MTERLRPGGDSASLVYTTQKIVELRYGQIKAESVQAAVKLFEDVSMELYWELKREGPYSKDLLPLMHAEDADVRALLMGVVFLVRHAQPLHPPALPPEFCLTTQHLLGGGA